LAYVIGHWAPTARSNLLIFQNKLGKNRILRALDWPSSVCG